MADDYMADFNLKVMYCPYELMIHRAVHWYSSQYCRCRATAPAPLKKHVNTSLQLDSISDNKYNLYRRFACDAICSIYHMWSVVGASQQYNLPLAGKYDVPNSPK
eukprot:6199654-Pleurochrysis_carterae.AAC.7